MSYISFREVHPSLSPGFAFKEIAHLSPPSFRRDIWLYLLPVGAYIHRLHTNCSTA